MICVGSSADIEEGRSKGLEVEGAYLFAVKRDDRIFLYRNSCPHLGTPWNGRKTPFWIRTAH